MSPEKLQEGADWASREFYRTSRIFGRLLKGNWRNPLFYLSVATAYKIGHYFHPDGVVERMHPLDKLDMLSEYDLAPPVPQWMARAANWSPKLDEPPPEDGRPRKVSLPTVDGPSVAADEPRIVTAHPLVGF
jgi:hypothetical protein